jgi:hypothetical protein
MLFVGIAVAVRKQGAGLFVAPRTELTSKLVAAVGGRSRTLRCGWHTTSSFTSTGFARPNDRHQIHTDTSET